MISKRVREMIEEGAAYPLAESSEEEEREFIKLCSNENPYGPSPKAIRAVKQGAEDVKKYPKSNAVRLKEAIADYVGVEPFQVCVGNGSDEVMDLACKAFMDPGDTALIPIPTFSQYELACRANAMELNFVELEDYQWSSEDLIEGIEGCRITFLGRPNNPTGNSLGEDGLEDLLETGKMIMVDEAYGEFSDYSVVDWIEDYENLLVLRTFSKAFGLAGLRVGYGIGNVELIKALERVRPPFSVNSLAQEAAIAALEDIEFMERSREKILEGRKNLQEELEDIGFDILDSSANFVMASPSTFGLNASDVCDFLAREGILIRNLSGFRGANSEWIRITVGKPDENKRLIEGLKKCIGDKK